MDAASNVTALLRLRSCFYLLWPSEIHFPSLEASPNFVGRVIPLVTVATVIEFIIMRFQGKHLESRFNNAVVTWSHVVIYDGFNNFLLRGIELSLYIWVYDNFRICTFHWDSTLTWFVALMTVECLNYWWHRCGHEIAIMWAAHELHHSSEDFNLVIAFRNNAPMRFFRWIFFVPLAPFGIPAAVMWAHVQLGALFNVFAHSALTPKLSTVIPGLGHVIEYVFVTPSHHRVHHGANKYCIDKNYGQYLIIWDRIFGTFEEERENEPITYGVLSQVESYDMGYMQVSSFISLWGKIKKMPTLMDKIRAIFYGPGWMPGKPRLGDLDDIPDVRGRKKWDADIPLLLNVYLVLNVFTIFFLYVNIMENLQRTSSLLHLFTLLYICFGYFSLGKLFDKRQNSKYLELLRMIFCFGFYSYFSEDITPLLKSVLLWINMASLGTLPFLSFQTTCNKSSIKGEKNTKLL